MFRPMRRIRQALSEAESRAILEHGQTGVLSVAGDNGYPYGVPVNYVMIDGKIVIHGAKTGHKIDAIAWEAKVSFCVIDDDTVVPAAYTTHFRSAIAFGHAAFEEDPDTMTAMLHALGKKYNPGDDAGRTAEIDRELAVTGLIVVTIDHLSGKEAIELVREREEREKHHGTGD